MTTTTLLSRSISITVWILRILVAGLFLFASFMKLSGQPMMVQEFDTVGLGQWFRYFTGTLEFLGAILVLVPTLSAFGAILLLMVDVGAFVAQVAVLQMDWIHTIVIGLLIAALIYLQRRQLAGYLRNLLLAVFAPAFLRSKRQTAQSSRDG